jgi:hypothetical protein
MTQRLFLELMQKFILTIILFLCIQVDAQTNLSNGNPTSAVVTPVNSAQKLSTQSKNTPADTNSLAFQYFQVTNQIDAIINVLPEYFDYKEDEVNGTATFNLKNYVTLGYDPTMEFDLLAFIPEKEVVARHISFHFVSTSQNTLFDEMHDITIRYDNQRISGTNSEYSNKILNDGSVIENIWDDFTLEEFHDIAWANTVYVKVGFKNYEIGYKTRQQWKLLWNYFNLQNKSDKLEDQINDQAIHASKKH